MPLVAELLVEPFVPGAPGPHVVAALDAARATGAVLEMGPFGTIVHGDDATVLAAVDAAVRAATAGGATRVSVQVAREH